MSRNFYAVRYVAGQRMPDLFKFPTVRDRDEWMSANQPGAGPVDTKRHRRSWLLTAKEPAE